MNQAQNHAAEVRHTAKSLSPKDRAHLLREIIDGVYQDVKKGNPTGDELEGLRRVRDAAENHYAALL